MPTTRRRDALSDVVIATRVTQDEARAIDAVRGSLSRAQWLRWQAVKALKGDRDAP